MTRRIDNIKIMLDKYIRAFDMCPKAAPKYIRVIKSDYEILRAEMNKHLKDTHKNYYPYKGHKVVPLYGVRFPDEEE